MRFTRTTRRHVLIAAACVLLAGGLSGGGFLGACSAERTPEPDAAAGHRVGGAASPRAGAGATEKPDDGGALYRRVSVPALPAGGPTFGATLLDLDDDDLWDLLLSTHAQRARLFVNTGGLSFEPAAATWTRPADQPDHHGSAACDYDGDGDWDVFVTVGAEHGEALGRNQLWRRDGAGRFTDAAAAQPLLQDPVGRGRGALWADFDGDARPELLLLNYASSTRLLAQSADGWQDVTERLPPPPPLVMWSEGRPPPPAQERVRSTWMHTAVVSDLDSDGWPDILAIGRPGGWSGLWINAGNGRFYDGTSLSGLKPALFPHLPSHAAAGDVDEDGDVDLVLAHLPDSTVHPQRAPLEVWLAEVNERGALFRRALTPDLAATQPRACFLADLDCDGHLDLYVVQEPAGQRSSPNLLFRGDGRGGFTAVSGTWGGTGPGTGHGESAWPVDLDRDGDLDLLTFHGGGEAEDPSGGVVLFENRGRRRGFTVELTTSNGPPHGLGARLAIELDGHVLVREIASVANPLNSAILPAHFGVGDHEGPVTLAVRWPAGRRVYVEIPAVGAAYRIDEDSHRVVRLGAGNRR